MHRTHHVPNRETKKKNRPFSALQIFKLSSKSRCELIISIVMRVLLTWWDLKTDWICKCYLKNIKYSLSSTWKIESYCESRIILVRLLPFSSAIHCDWIKINVNCIGIHLKRVQIFIRDVLLSNHIYCHLNSHILWHCLWMRFYGLSSLRNELNFHFNELNSNDTVELWM